MKGAAMTRVLGSADATDLMRVSDGVLAAAGHTVSDEFVNEVRKLAAAGEITADEAVSRVKARYQNP